MNREIRKELTRIKNDIYNEVGISYDELHFLQCHQQEVLEYGDIRLAEWSGITEEEWNAWEEECDIPLF